MRPRCTLVRPGTVAYERALAMQHRYAGALREGGNEALILLEHAPVYTLGVRGRSEHVLASESALRARGAEVVRTDRGGDVTFHGPGQIVGYPILDLRARGIGPATYVRMLEQMLIDTLTRFEVEAERVEGRPGVWAGGAKIAAIGVRVSRGITTHGFALNVRTDLSFFEHIIPCGITGATVTSMERELDAAPAQCDVEDVLVTGFERTFGTVVSATPITDRSEDLSLQVAAGLMPGALAAESAIADRSEDLSRQVAARLMSGEVLVGR